MYVSTLYWMKNTLLFTYSTNILVRLLTVNLKNCLTPKNQEMCDHILGNSIRKMLPHHSHSSCEYATPSSGTFPLASYKEVPPPGSDTDKKSGVLAFFISQYLASIPATCKYTDKKGKTAAQQSWKISYCRRTGVISSIHMMLGVNSHCRFTSF